MERRVRLGCGKALLRRLEKDNRMQHARVQDAIRAQTRSDYDSLNGLRWISLASHMDLCDRIRDELGGGDGYVAFWQRAFGEFFEHPMLASFMRAVTRLADDPGVSAFQRVPRLHNYLFENAGVVRTQIVSPDGRTGLWTVDRFPADEHSFGTFVEGACGGMKAMEDVLQERIHTEVTSLQEDGSASVLVERSAR